MINCVVVDDEKFARQVLKHHIKKTDNLFLVAECQNGLEATTVIKELQPDIVFLDIQMPNKSGLVLAKEIPKNTEIIFTTALENHALQSYELDALDYLLKPITYERFEQAVNKYNKWVGPDNKNAPLSEPLNDSPSVIIRANRKNNRVLMADILYVSGLKDYVKVVTKTGHLVPNHSMAYMEDKLASPKFLRVHRSFIINLDFMTAYTSHDIELTDGSEIPIGQSYKERVFKILETI